MTAWSRSVIIFVIALAAIAALSIAALAALDPYDTGRFTLVPVWHGRINGDKVSRARDLQFDSAIIGNSRMQMVRPDLLDQRTGLKFVSLTIHAAGPLEEMAVLRYFLRHRQETKSIVIGLDDTWCQKPLLRQPAVEFVPWLYTDSAPVYLAHLLSLRAAKRAWDTMHAGPTSSRADGFEDYGPGFHAVGADTIEAVQRKLPTFRPTAPFGSEAGFPAVSLLRDTLDDLSPEATLVLAWVPVNITFIPVPGSRAEKAFTACVAAYAALVSARSHTQTINWFVDRPEGRADENWYDQVHYRSGIGNAFSKDIAAALATALATWSSRAQKRGGWDGAGGQD